MIKENAGYTIIDAIECSDGTYIVTGLNVENELTPWVIWHYNEITGCYAGHYTDDPVEALFVAHSRVY